MKKTLQEHKLDMCDLMCGKQLTRQEIYQLVLSKALGQIYLDLEDYEIDVDEIGLEIKLVNNYFNDGLAVKG